jgi:glycosyltransferase involved in cell wall biosynthesis
VATYHTHLPDYVPHLLDNRLPDPFSKISSYTVKKMIKHAFRLADTVTAPTHELVKELRSYGLKHAIYLPNGVELKRFRPDGRKGAAFRKRYAIPKDRSVVLYLGRVSFEKKLEVLLQAFSMIEDEGRVLVIAGKGPYLDTLKDMAKALGIRNIVFTGYLKDISEAYAAADIFASASDTETFGLTFIEAMHTGVPVIGARRLGPKELIHHGKDGLLVKPGSVPDMAKAMDGLLKDLPMRRRMGKEAMKSSESYSLENSIRMTLDLYRKLMKVS